MKIQLAVVLVLATGCNLHLHSRRPDSRRDGPVRTSPAPLERGGPRAGSVLRVKEIKAGLVRARVIHCKEIHADSGSVGRVYRAEGERDWGGEELRADVVEADTIYAKEIHAERIEAGEARCKEVKVGR